MAKKSCKNIDICNIQYIRPFVEDCCRRHKKRSDFKQLFIQHGISLQQYNKAIDECDFTILYPAIDNICKSAVKQIKNRSLLLTRVKIRTKKDPTTGKIRKIGWESAMQQVFDYIAVYSSMEIFDRRIVKEQASSIRGRGQIYGVHLIQNKIVKDYRAYQYAIKHNLSYIKKRQYFVKLDIELCYPSARYQYFINLFSKDCANKDLIWLWEELLKSHMIDGYKGFLIGAWPSQWAVQYLISFIYRYAKDLHYYRRNKRFKSVDSMIIFMDDMVLFSSNRKILKSAVRNIISWTKKNLHWTIKPNWSIRSIDDCSVDMMGYVIHYDGHITIRARNFIHSRRMVLRYDQTGKLNLQNARRALAYKGFNVHSNSEKISRKYCFDKMYYNASLLISEHDRRINENRKNRFRGEPA